MKKVLVITYYWPPSGGAGVQRSLKFVKYLPEFGIRPVVLTVDENKAFYPFTDHSLLKDVSPDLKVVKTQKEELLRKFSRLFPKIEVPHSGFANHDKKTLLSKAMRFVRGNLLIPDARVGWVNAAYEQAVRILEEEDIDTYYISSPPHSSQLIGLKLKKRFPGKKWIVDFRDPWTDIYFYKDLLHTRLAANIDAGYEKKVLRQADAILVASRGAGEIFASKVPGVERKIHFIPNGFDSDDFRVPSHPPRDEFLITYAGTLADIYEPEVVFSALKKIIGKYGDRCPVRLLFVGKVTGTVRRFAEAYGIEKQVDYVEYVPHAEVVPYLRNTTCLLLVIPQVDLAKGIIPGKMFEYLAARKPIWAIGPERGDIRDILELSGGGKVFARTQEDEMVAYLDHLVQRWMENRNLDTDSAEIERFSRRNLTGVLSRIIRGEEVQPFI